MWISLKLSFLFYARFAYVIYTSLTCNNTWAQCLSCLPQSIVWHSCTLHTHTQHNTTRQDAKQICRFCITNLFHALTWKTVFIVRLCLVSDMQNGFCYTALVKSVASFIRRNKLSLHTLFSKWNIQCCTSVVGLLRHLNHHTYHLALVIWLHITKLVIQSTEKGWKWKGKWKWRRTKNGSYRISQVAIFTKITQTHTHSELPAVRYQWQEYRN